MFKVKGEILIERQIEQLKNAGINTIYIVIGYMKEKFFYLENKYNVKLIVNNKFSKGNILSLYSVKDYLSNTFICCADHYYPVNPFLQKNELNISYRPCYYQEGKFREFSVDVTDANVISKVAIGGKDKLVMSGYAYINEKFSLKLKRFLEDEVYDFGIANMFWEEFYAKHMDELTMYYKEVDSNYVLEFDSIDDLRQFDSEFLINVDSDIITNICNTLKCNPNDVKDINVIQAGLTNVSFSFFVGNTKYVYRHPGGTAGNLIDREAELFAQTSARILGVDKSVIYMDITGWKISYFVKDIVECDFKKYQNQMKLGMEYLHKIHSTQITKDIKVFDDVLEGKKLMKIASATKGNLFSEFKDIIDKIDILDKYVKEDAVKLGYKNVLCHNDTYEPNYLATKDNDLYLIDCVYSKIKLSHFY